MESARMRIARIASPSSLLMKHIEQVFSAETGAGMTTITLNSRDGSFSFFGVSHCPGGKKGFGT
jgi:hypothetical protein